MPSIGKDKIVNMGGGMNYINADCLGACNGNPETNLTDYKDWGILSGGTLSREDTKVILTTSNNCYGLVDIERTLKPNTTYKGSCNSSFTGTYPGQYGMRVRLNQTWRLVTNSDEITFTTDNTGIIQLAYYVGLPYTTAGKILTLDNIKLEEVV